MSKEVERSEMETVRRVAFLGVTVSTIATLACVVVVPMVYNYVQQVDASLQHELGFCRLRSGNIAKEITRAQVGRGKINGVVGLLDNNIKVRGLLGHFGSIRTLLHVFGNKIIQNRNQ